VSGVITISQLDLNGNPVAEVATGSGNLPSPGRLAVMAATGADLRLLLVILIAMELPISGLLSVAGC
jgi:hypothetical protein